jgi:signal transduction histidine kinase
VDVRLEPGDGLLVEAPERVLSIAVGNLLANALNATSQGWVCIVLEVSRVTISDTGPGIEPERLAVTGPYVTSGSGGHGLGLAIVREICERFGWRLELHSRHGEGTRAVLRFQTI